MPHGGGGGGGGGGTQGQAPEGAMVLLSAKAMAKARGRAISLLFIYHISSSFLPRERGLPESDYQLHFC